MNFVAIDVETANPDMASICQIGIAKYENGQLINEWVSLINPEDYFNPININIHGISASDVEDKPKLPAVISIIEDYIKDTFCICHTHFDRVSIHQAMNKYNIPDIQTTWVDSARIARRTWEECAWKGYGLKDVCKLIGYEFTHHDALEDAKAAGQIVISAIKKTGLDLQGWIKRVRQPINPSMSSCGSAIIRAGTPGKELYGEKVVFTGTLSITRREASDLAASVGCAVNSGVTKETTILVIGDQDLSKLAGKKKSSKHLKAEKLILSDQNIRILKESDFIELVSESKDEAE